MDTGRGQGFRRAAGPAARVGRTLALGVALWALLPAPRATAGDYPFGLPLLAPDDFNRLAHAVAVPLFWEEGAGGDGRLSPGELRLLASAPAGAAFLSGPGFGPDFEPAYRRLVEARRVEALARELAQGRPTLVRSDLRALPANEKRFVALMEGLARQIDALYELQRGAASLRRELDAGQPLARAVFDRNHGPWCEAPETEGDPFCNALAAFPARRFDAYPADEPHDAALCSRLKAHPQSLALLDPFTAVRKKNGDFVAVPYAEAYAGPSASIARDLRAAAGALTGAGEEALERYLLAAARAFETNVWGPADEAWAAMSATNSRYYVRIGPDEVYADLCQAKAAYHLSFARIDPASLPWQQRLAARRTDLERQLATLIGPPYKPRPVTFQLPDFINIVLNAGASRQALGAVAGQSLPNWGAVAQEGRGRTVVMTNLYEDPDSRRLRRALAARLLSPATMADYADEPLASRLAVMLHEIVHNLGPHSDYAVAGKTPRQLFGGELATLLEELKAQTGALYFVAFLLADGAIDDRLARQIYVHELAWALEFMGRGLFGADGRPKTYGQVGAVQIGFFLKSGVLRWVPAPPEAPAGSGGRFEVDLARLPAAVTDLMRQVGHVKARGEVAAARALVDPFLTGPETALLQLDEVSARVRSQPKASFVYAIER